MIIDTHCHLDFEEFDSDREAVIGRAHQAGVSYFINIGSSLEGSKKSIELARRYKNVYATVGVHPHHADEVTDELLVEIEDLAKNERVVAIGEVGLDYVKSPSGKESQKEAFVKFIGLSRGVGLPLVVHSRQAHEDTLEILRENCKFPVRGVMHCFSGKREFLNEVLEIGLFVSFTCNLTFKNAGALREVARYVPAERLLLETDAPFLAPQVYRGKRNEPAYITELRDVLAQLLDLSVDEIERITTNNAKRLFGIQR